MALGQIQAAASRRRRISRGAARDVGLWVTKQGLRRHRRHRLRRGRSPTAPDRNRRRTGGIEIGGAGFSVERRYAESVPYREKTDQMWQRFASLPIRNGARLRRQTLENVSADRRFRFGREADPWGAHVIRARGDIRTRGRCRSEKPLHSRTRVIVRTHGRTRVRRRR